MSKKTKTIEIDHYQNLNALALEISISFTSRNRHSSGNLPVENIIGIRCFYTSRRSLNHGNNNLSVLFLILDETLILVTADHSHSFTLFGAAKRGNPIFGFQSELALDGKPALTLSYADGPSGLIGNQTRGNLTDKNYDDPHFQQQALIKKYYESHSAEDVGQFVYLLTFVLLLLLGFIFIHRLLDSHEFVSKYLVTKYRILIG